jgi:thiol:disulfide interchange protein
VLVGATTLCASAFAETSARKQDPVHWSATAAATPARTGGTFDVAVSARVDDEWYVYSVTQGPGGPVPTSIAVGPKVLFTRAGAIRGPAPRSAYDPNFEIQTEKYEGAFTLTVPVALAASAPRAGATVSIAVTYQACTNRLCLPPQTETLRVPVKWSESPGTSREVRGESREARGADAPASVLAPPASPLAPSSAPAAPPASPIAPRAFGASADSWSAFIWLAVSMGALSLLTPCVFPMVPITVSYFTNNAAATRARAMGSAALYGLGIVLTFTVLGSVLAAVAGAAGLSRFAANPWVNLAITAMFIVFALNLFGLYDVRLPFRMLSRLDGMSRRRGASVTGTLLMAVTFTVTSLTCTAAFLGTLLVVAAQGEWRRPVAGLVAYSLTFALPFVALAAAPQLVSQLPRSGPWLARVKVVMGFLEIAAAMKFLSNADLVWSWGIFTRDVVLVAWILTAVALAVYLVAPSTTLGTGPSTTLGTGPSTTLGTGPSTTLGTGHRPGIGRVTTALATLLFAAWLGSGVAGRPLGELEAFLPPSRVHAASGELSWITDDLDGALAQARAARQLIFIDFTGYTCTNCRWMEANMFTRPEVRDVLAGFVRARLYTDGQGAVYEKQQRYQEERFKTVALPLYALVDADQRTVATFAGLTRDSQEFLRFLAAGR